MKSHKYISALIVLLFLACNPEDFECLTTGRYCGPNGESIAWEDDFGVKQCGCLCKEGFYGRRCENECDPAIKMKCEAAPNARYFQDYKCFCLCEEGWCGPDCTVPKQNCNIFVAFAASWDDFDCECKCKYGGEFPNCKYGVLRPSLKVNDHLKDVYNIAKESSDDDYFPLILGSTFIYQFPQEDGSAGPKYGIRILDTVRIDSRLMYDSDDIYFDSLGQPRDTSVGSLFYSPAEKPNEVHIYLEPSKSQFFGLHLYNIGDTLSSEIDPYDAKHYYTVVDQIDTVKTPAGVFTNCIYLRNEEDSGPVYAPNIGLIKFFDQNKDAMHLIEFSTGCTMKLSAIISDASCASTTDGSIKLMLNDDFGSVDFYWIGPTDPGNTSNPKNLLPGVYSVLAVNAEGCFYELTDLKIESQNDLSINTELITHPRCSNSSDGAIHISVSGGSGNYSFSWNNGKYTTEDLNEMPAGTYTVTVSDNSSCSIQKTFVLKAPSALSIQTSMLMPVSCKARKDGMISVKASGGTPPYSYSWNQDQYTGKDLTDLSEGIYELIVTDAHGCKSSQRFDLGIRPSDIPASMSVQGLLTDTALIALPDGYYDIRFRMYSSGTQDSLLWEELHLDQYIESGLFSVLLGQITALDLCFDKPYYLGISVDGAEEMSPKIELSSSPYSLMARNVEDGAISNRKIKDGAVSVEKILPDVLSGINGLRNDGGEIQIKAGENVSLSTDSSDHSITINAHMSADSLDQKGSQQAVASLNQIPGNGDNIDILAGENIFVSTDSSKRSITISSSNGPSQHIGSESIVPDIVSSINQIRNDGGNIDILAGENITISSDSSAKSITIAAIQNGINGSNTSPWKQNGNEVSFEGKSIELLREDQSVSAQMSEINGGTGYIATRGPNGNVNVHLTTLSGSPNHGYLAVRDDQGNTKAGVYVSSSSIGIINLYGPAASSNVILSSISSNSDHGFMGVRDAEGATRAGAYVDSEGQGRIFADLYESFVEHPDKSGRVIRNLALQGPEAGIYLRGTGRLLKGLGQVDLPDYFSELLSTEGITVMITPLSAQSRGIAVIKKGVSGFRVQELLDGKGDYEFDWEVKGIRRGFENLKALSTQRPQEAKDESEENKRP